MRDQKGGPSNSSNVPQPEHGPGGQASGDGVDRAAAASRRKFIMAGLVGVPMIVTLRSKPARAMTSLGSAGIFYGAYAEDTTGKWRPVNENGEFLVDPTRRSNAVEQQAAPAPTPKKSRTPGGSGWTQPKKGRGGY